MAILMSAAVYKMLKNCIEAVDKLCLTPAPPTVSEFSLRECTVPLFIGIYDHGSRRRSRCDRCRDLIATG